MKKVATLVWRGRFYLGPLQRPVSIGDALLKLFEVIWKTIVVVIATALAVALAIYVYFTFLEPAPLKDRVYGTARIDRKACPDKGYPLSVEFKNGSNKNIGLISFEIEARRRGTTTNLADDYVGRKADYILRAGFRMTACYMLPEKVALYDPDDLDFAISINYVDEYDGPLPPVIHVTAPNSTP